MLDPAKITNMPFELKVDIAINTLLTHFGAK